MCRICRIVSLIPITVSLLTLLSCAYFNTYYNAEKYFKEAERIRLEKDGKSLPLKAMDNYGKTIQKCNAVLSEYPDSKLVNNATLLMAKAQFYRTEYDEALDNLKIINENGDASQKEESKYWSAVCKWKTGKVQFAIDELKMIIKNTNNQRIRAQAHLSLSDISKELDRDDEFLYHLEQGALTMKDRAERALIFNKIGKIAFEGGKYSVAEKSYKEVIKNSLSKDKIENAHIQLLRIARINGNIKDVERKIKSMLVDNKFINIKPDLELELVKIYLSQKDIDNAIVRLEYIVNEFQKTKFSAEAYFMMGEIYLSSKWNVVTAKEKFSQVKKEYSKSEFSSISQDKINAIDLYDDLRSNYDSYINMHLSDVVIDSVNADSIKKDIELPVRSYEEVLYLLAEIEAFSFSRKDSGIVFLEKVLDSDRTSKFYPKSLFSLCLLYEQKEDKKNSLYYKNILKNEFPESDYTAYLFKNDNNEKMLRPIELSLLKAEKLWNTNPSDALVEYKNIINSDSLSEYSASAAYFLAYQYDYKFALVDSAIKYYQWLDIYHPYSSHNITAKSRMVVLKDVINKKNKVEEGID
tara:strand:- start:507 stop:2246 length:1740 start_codon:yes stop_codon:yes gene_type:complete